MKKRKTEHPILFSGPMVRAILDGKKTQTRRIVKNLEKLTVTEFPKNKWHYFAGFCKPVFGYTRFAWGAFSSKEDAKSDLINEVCPYKVGDTLWVRETAYISKKNFCERSGLEHVYEQGPNHAAKDSDGDIRLLGFVANSGRNEAAEDYGIKQTPSIFMPKWASRITLKITKVRLEQIQEISTEDCIAEGFSSRLREYDAQVDLWEQFEMAWNKIYGAESWNQNV